MISTVIIGSGNVSEALAVALTEAGEPPVQIFARNKKDGAAIASICGCGYTDSPSLLAKADLYLVAVSDKAIANVAKTLAFGDAVVAHTAGSVNIEELPVKIRNRAVFYPLQTFTKGRRVNFREVPVFIEGTTPRAVEMVRIVAGLLSDSVVEMDSQRRATMHLAAVFASNFTNYMYTVGEELAAEAQMDFSMLKPLILETAGKAASARTPCETQTGPAIRNDFATKSLHCEMLTEKPNLKSLYINLSKNIWETSKKILRK